MQLSVVIPFHDEEENVAALLAEVHSALEGRFEYEVIGVDDGSDDRTGEILDALRAKYPRLRPLHHEACYGQSAGLLSGVRAARFDWVATIDGDGQNDPADLPNLAAAAESPEAPADLRLVMGRRRKRHDTWVRRVSSRVANGVRRSILRDTCDDSGCGIKLFRRDAFLDLPFFDHLHRFLPPLVERRGGRVISVDVNHRPRRGGKSKYGIGNRLWVGIVDLFGVVWLQRRAVIVRVRGAETPAPSSDSPPRS